MCVQALLIGYLIKVKRVCVMSTRARLSRASREGPKITRQETSAVFSKSTHFKETTTVMTHFKQQNEF